MAVNYPREFAGEPFFMAYGNLAANNLLSTERTGRIARYRAARLALLTELRGQLDRGPDASALAGLAALQTPRLLELEAEAEQIRHDLTHVELLKTTADDIGQLMTDHDGYNQSGSSFFLPSYHLGRVISVKKDPKLSGALAALRQFLSAAHSRDGFSPDQRRLLEEMAQEIVLTIEPEPGPAAVFFWPAGARIPAPIGLPPEAAARFEEFQQCKSALKEELRAAVDRDRRQLFNLDSTGSFAQLAAAQASRFAGLDRLADEIRPALAALADAGDTLAAGLPADLARQITSLVERKAALQRDLYARLAEFRSRLPADRLALTRQGGGLAITVVTNSDTPSNRELMLARINEFNEELAGRFTALAVVRERVRADIARHQATVPGTMADVTVDRLAADFLAAYRARENRNRQRDYAAAVLTPGLSPAQRRLLLAAAAADALQEPAASVP